MRRIKTQTLLLKKKLIVYFFERKEKNMCS